MINITDSAAFARAMDSPIDSELRHLLQRRRDQLLADTSDDYDLGDLVQFIAVELGDTVAAIEAAANYPLITNPAFEWVADHGGWYEAVAILSDDGFGIALFVPNNEAIDPTVLHAMRSHVLSGTLQDRDIDHGGVASAT